LQSLVNAQALQEQPEGWTLNSTEYKLQLAKSCQRSSTTRTTWRLDSKQYRVQASACRVLPTFKHYKNNLKVGLKTAQSTSFSLQSLVNAQALQEQP